MEESRKHALLFATTLLAARELATHHSGKPLINKQYIIEKALLDAEAILEVIDSRYSPEAEEARAKHRTSWGIKPETYRGLAEQENAD